MKAEEKFFECRTHLLESADLVIPFMKAVGHPHRYRIMIELMEGPCMFRTLQQLLGLARTATANHLSHLLEAGLIQKPDRGSYKISPNGRDFLTLIYDFYKKSKIQELNAKRRLQNQYTQAYRSTSKPKLLQVPRTAFLTPTGLSYVGAVTGVLTSIGCPWDLNDLAGYSGYIFLTNVVKDKLCPSGPTRFTPYVWKTMVKSVEYLGFQIHQHGDRKSYPESPEFTAEDQLRAAEFKHWVAETLGKTDRPVIAFGLPIPEFGIINGLQDDFYLCSTYDSSRRKELVPIHYLHIQAPGGLWGISVNSVTVNSWERYTPGRDHLALQQGVSFMKEVAPAEGCTLGLGAYEDWARNLERSQVQEGDYHGNSYVGMILVEQKHQLSVFLTRMADRYPTSPAAPHLTQAAEDFSQVADILQKFYKIFPFSLQGTFLPIDKAKGAALLRSIRPFEQSALGSLENALITWDKT